MIDYRNLTNEDFDRILGDIMQEAGGRAILTIPGVYEVVSEHFNNDVLDRWEQETQKQGALSRNTVQEYIDSLGSFCPYCRSEKITQNTTDLEESDGYVEKEMRCEDCKAVWQSIFKLADICEVT